mmetsp:Transcript_10657/g.24720  ORF Transcript_10657/g.24720 Transcript_10657/m.24720 type:complete len:251 (-) Transcript_10657:95-847(-)
MPDRTMPGDRRTMARRAGGTSRRRARGSDRTAGAAQGSRGCRQPSPGPSTKPTEARHRRTSPHGRPTRQSRRTLPTCTGSVVLSHPQTLHHHPPDATRPPRLAPADALRHGRGTPDPTSAPPPATFLQSLAPPRARQPHQMPRRATRPRWPHRPSVPAAATFGTSLHASSCRQAVPSRCPKAAACAWTMARVVARRGSHPRAPKLPVGAVCCATEHVTGAAPRQAAPSQRRCAPRLPSVRGRRRRRAPRR